jgi:superfamily II DNA or RNA helicase
LPLLENIADYLRAHAQELGDRILESYPPLYAIDDPVSPLISKLLRKPYPAQTLAIMGLVRRWQQARAGAVIAECGTGKTLISLGAVYTHAEGRPFTAIAMVPPQLVEKWCREAFLTLPYVRVFIIDGLRTPTNCNTHHGVNEVKLRNASCARDCALA